MSLAHELRVLDAINSSGLSMTRDTLGHELKALDAMNNFGLWLTRMIHAQLVYLDFGPQTRVINKIYNLYHHVLG